MIHHWNCLLKPILFLHLKYRVNGCQYSPNLSTIGLRDVYLVADLDSQSDLVSQSDLFSHSDLVSLSDLFSLSELFSQSDLISQSKLNNLTNLVNHTLILIVISVSQVISHSLSLFTFKI